jgi:putative chitinase
MARDAAEWLRVLGECGVRHSVAERWAPVFAAEITDDTFSAGDAEVPVFLAQFLHETGMLEHLEENLNYSAGRISEIGMASKPGTRWRSLVPRALELGRNPRGFAEAVYGGRMGNDEPGDGWKFRGRGGQITGKNNYRRIGDLMGIDLLADPDLLIDPTYALRSFIVLWEADVPDEAIDTADVTDETLAVNGGVIGKKERQRLADLCVRVCA